MNHYILKYRKPVLCNDFAKWGKWFETAHRRVRLTVLNDMTISTVFLGIDHGWDGTIQLFETAIFKNEDADIMYRCATWRQALEQHRSTVYAVKKRLKQKT